LRVRCRLHLMVEVANGALVLERERELDVVHAACRAVGSGRGRLIVVDGAAGVGKTLLMNAAAEAAEAAGLEVARTRGGELEQDLGWGIAADLLDPVLPAALGRSVSDYSPGADDGPRPCSSTAKSMTVATVGFEPTRFRSWLAWRGWWANLPVSARSLCSWTMRSGRTALRCGGSCICLAGSSRCRC